MVVLRVSAYNDRFPPPRLPVEIICIQKVEVQSALQKQQATKKPRGDISTWSVDFLTSQLRWLYYLQHAGRQTIVITSACSPLSWNGSKEGKKPCRKPARQSSPTPQGRSTTHCWNQTQVTFTLVISHNETFYYQVFKAVYFLPQKTTTHTLAWNQVLSHTSVNSLLKK